MTGSLCLPIDDVSGASIDFDRAADFLELSAFFANDSTALASDLVNQSGIGAEEDPVDLDEEFGEWGRGSHWEYRHPHRQPA